MRAAGALIVPAPSSTLASQLGGDADVIPAVGHGQTANPMVVYLARLAPGSRRTMAGALQTVATLLAGERADPLALP